MNQIGRDIHKCTCIYLNIYSLNVRVGDIKCQKEAGIWGTRSWTSREARKSKRVDQDDVRSQDSRSASGVTCRDT
jgi:hypothetical protein